MTSVPVPAGRDLFVRICEKWLKDRRGRTLSYEDIVHYQKVVVALGETIGLMGERCLAEMFEKKKNRKTGFPRSRE